MKTDPDESIALVSLSGRRLILQDGKRLMGECHRCRKCCEENPAFPDGNGSCKYLVYDIVKENGEKGGTCSLGARKPVSCAFWPEVDDETPEGCGYYWIEE